MAFDSALNKSKSGKLRFWFPAVAVVALVLGGCNRESTELKALRDENERLKKALELARSNTPAVPEAEGGMPSKVDLDLTMVELWTQRFQDNQFRAKQRLDQKQVRVTGLVENISDRSVTIFGTGTRFGSVSLVAQLEESYVKQIADGLASLKKGALVTVQGRFLFDKMWLDGAIFVDRGTGNRLGSKDLTAITGPEEQSQVAPPPAENAGKSE